MYDCIVTIVTHTQGKRSTFSARGTIEGETIRTVRYREEKDDVTLTFLERELLMTRVGETSLSSRFIKGEQTAFTLRCGANEGTIPVVTHEYAVTAFLSGEISARLFYALRYPQTVQKFRLMITVKIILEEK